MPHKCLLSFCEVERDELPRRAGRIAVPTGTLNGSGVREKGDRTDDRCKFYYRRDRQTQRLTSTIVTERRLDVLRTLHTLYVESVHYTHSPCGVSTLNTLYVESKIWYLYNPS